MKLQEIASSLPCNHLCDYPPDHEIDGYTVCTFHCQLSTISTLKSVQSTD